MFWCDPNEHWWMRLLLDHHTIHQKQRPWRWSVQTVWRRSVFSSGRVELIHRCGEVDSTREVSVHVTFLLFLFLYSQNTTFLVRDERRVTIGGKNCGRFLRLEWLSTKVCLLCLSVSQTSQKVVFQVWSHTQQTVVVSFKLTPNPRSTKKQNPHLNPNLKGKTKEKVYHTNLSKKQFFFFFFFPLFWLL